MDQALALSMTKNAGDLARAQALLDQVLHNNTPQADPWRSLARLLAYRLGEQKRAEDAAERSAQQLRDAQRDNQRKLDDVNSQARGAQGDRAQPEHAAGAGGVVAQALTRRHANAIAALTRRRGVPCGHEQRCAHPRSSTTIPTC